MTKRDFFHNACIGLSSNPKLLQNGETCRSYARGLATIAKYLVEMVEEEFSQFPFDDE